ncbi:MAG: urease accessory UreF family protein [Pseudomonadota bacterium]
MAILKPISTTMTDQLALLRLLQLASPALPIGAFNFSQGLEFAIEHGGVDSESEARDWIIGLARHSMATLDVPMLLRLHAAWSEQDAPRAHTLSAELLASRETMELRAEELHLGQSLARILAEFGMEPAREWLRCNHTTHAAMFALAAANSGVPAQDAATAFLWAWAENQVIAAVKLLPLGQTAGQRMLEEIRLQIPSIIAAASELPDESLGTATPLAVMASAWHETQYTRLFRS